MIILDNLIRLIIRKRIGEKISQVNKAQFDQATRQWIDEERFDLFAKKAENILHPDKSPPLTTEEEQILNEVIAKRNKEFEITHEILSKAVEKQKIEQEALIYKNIAGRNEKQDNELKMPYEKLEGAIKQKNNELDKINSKNKLALIMVIFFILLFLALYFFNFHQGFSDNQSDWGNFGSYAGGVIGVVLSCVSMILSTSAIREQIKSNDEQRVRIEEDKERMRKEQLISKITDYINIYKNTAKEKTFINDFVKINKKIANGDDMQNTIDHFVLSDASKRLHAFDNVLISLNKLKNIDHDEFQFILNKTDIESDEITKKYLILAINSFPYKNNVLFKKYLFWYISIKSEILIKHYTQSLQQLLSKSCPDGHYSYIPWN